ncbi:MAG: U32 family peptidase, partial [Bacteroidales bacterium]|nr:U32 family peptidase [Bacteroidales bacterium]
TKDLCLIDKLDDLVGLVDSLKIEGRMKSKDYVSLVTNASR